MRFRSSKCLLPDLLKERRITARELSEITGISETSLSDYASKRKKMSIDTAKTIAEAFQVPIDDLYTWGVDPPSSTKSRQKQSRK